MNSVQSDSVYPNTLPYELHNLLFVFLVVLFLAWALRLCRIVLHVQDLRAGRQRNTVRRLASINDARRKD